MRPIKFSTNSDFAHCVFGLVIGSLFLWGNASADGQSDQSTLRAVDKNLADYFRAETRHLADSCLAEFSSLEKWQSRQEELRSQLFEMLGLDPLPQKADLEVVYTGSLKKKDFEVRKLHFQSLPGLYVTGNLYIPRESATNEFKKKPAVLYVCGHGKVKKNGISYGNKTNYHHHGVWLARNGFVCLMIDTLQLGEIEGLHHGTYRHGMWWWLNRGYTPAGVEAWNGIRAVDFLQSLPEVDPEKIGVTGRSGGGAYSWWLAALDERIQCAVPVAGITDLENHVVDGCVEGHCDCMFMVNTYRWDYPLVAALVAPRPLLISNTDDDRIFPLDGVYRTYRKVKRIYDLYGASNKIGFNITAGPHKDTQDLRISAFRWLNKHLKNDSSLVQFPAEKIFQPEELRVFDKLPGDQINTKVQELFVAAAIDRWLPTELDKTDMIARIREQSFGGFPRSDTDLGIKKSTPIKMDSSALGPAMLTEIKFESQEFVPLDIQILHRVPLSDIKVIEFRLLGREEIEDYEKWRDLKLSAAQPALVDRFLPREIANSKTPFVTVRGDSRALAFFRPRGLGANRWDRSAKYQHLKRRFYLLGQTVDGMRVYDIERGLKAARDVTRDQAEIHLIGEKSMGINGLYAYLMKPGVQSVTLIDPPLSHREGPFYLNIRKLIDIPQAVAMAAEKTKVVIVASDSETEDAFREIKSDPKRARLLEIQVRKKQLPLQPRKQNARD